MLDVNVWMGKHFTYLNVFGCIRMVLLQQVCLPCFGHDYFMVADESC